jgi:acid phosphatase (class A)
MARDQQTRSAALLLRDTQVYARAKADAVRDQSNTAADFDCALGVPINEAATPRLYELLSRVRLDVRAASYSAKSHYARARPFDANGVHSCYPDDEAMVRKDGSYPSARGAVGWAYAYVLGQLAPERVQPIGQRARQFAQSRVVCDQEWQSDIDAAPAVSNIIVERERLKPAFIDDLAAAKAEIAAQVMRGAEAPSCDAPLRLASR